MYQQPQYTQWPQQGQGEFAEVAQKYLEGAWVQDRMFNGPALVAPSSVKCRSNCVNLDRYDVLYEDGTTEARVAAKRLRRPVPAPEAEGAGKVSRDRQAKYKPKDRVEVKKGKEWRTATVDRVVKSDFCSQTFIPLDHQQPLTLTYYQKAVAALMHPATTCRRLLVVASTGAGKSCMVTALMSQFADYSLYPNPRKIDPLDREAFRQAYAKPVLPDNEDLEPAHPGVPSKLVFVTFRVDLWGQMYEDLGARCPGIGSSPYLRSCLRKYVEPEYMKLQANYKGVVLSPGEPCPKPSSGDKAGSSSSNEDPGVSVPVYMLAKAWRTVMGVEFKKYSTIANMIHNKRDEFRKEFNNALWIFDEVQTIISPEGSTSGQYTPFFPLILTLGEIPDFQVYGIVGLTATPLPTSFKNLFDLNRMFIAGHPGLDPEWQAKHLPAKLDRIKRSLATEKDEDIRQKLEAVRETTERQLQQARVSLKYVNITGSCFEHHYIMKEPIQLPHETVMKIPAMMTACKKGDATNASYLFRNTFRQGSQELLTAVFAKLQHYVLYYNAENDLRSFPRRRNTYVLSNGGALGYSTEEDDKVHNKADLHFRWVLRTLQEKPDQKGKKSAASLRLDTINVDQLGVLKKNLLGSNIFRLSKVQEFYADTPTNRAIYSDDSVFFPKLYALSPILYECFKRLMVRKGKAVVWTAVPDSAGASVLYGILTMYVKARPYENMLLTIPRDISPDKVDAIIQSKILFIWSNSDSVLLNVKQLDKGPYEVAKKRKLDTFVNDGEQTPSLSPILIFTTALSTGFSINAAVREMHILGVALSKGLETQVRGRPYRQLGFCSTATKFPDDWLLDYVTYVNVGLFPKLISSCDMLFHMVRKHSNVDKINDFLMGFYGKASLACRAFQAAHPELTQCNTSPEIPEDLKSTAPIKGDPATCEVKLPSVITQEELHGPVEDHDD